MRNLILVAILIIGWTTSYSQVNPSDVTIVRDTFGVPHIYGISDADAAYGLAWAHCEDDFENVQKGALAGKGLAGSVEGKDGVLFDFGLQYLRIDSLVDARYELDLSPEYRSVVEAYAQGMNAFAESYPKEVLHKRLFPVTGKELVNSYTLSLALMSGLGISLKAVNEGRIEEILGMNDFSIGSNALAVAPERMDDDRSYLLVNSHQPIEGRFSWYEAHINSEEGWNCVGGLFAGGVTVFVGSNEHLGWAHTFNYHQFGDVHELKLNPKNRNQYMYDGQWKDFHVRKIKLKVKVAGIVIPVTKKVKWCAYGPAYKSKYGMYGFRFPGYTDIRAGEQWFRMNKSKNFGEFTQAMEMQAVPLFNTVYADDVGNIMLHSGGKVPKRDPKLDWTPPITANTSDYRWTEIMPYSSLPHVENPECGYVFNANNTPLNCTGDSCEWYQPFPGVQTFMYNRGERFDYLLKEHQGKFSEDDLKRIKYDMAYQPGGEYEQHFDTLYHLDETKYPDIADAISLLKSWDMTGHAESKEAALALVVHDVLAEKNNAPFAFLMLRKAKVTEKDAVFAIRKAKKFLLKKHGTLEVPLGNIQRMIRGDKSLPAHGLKEVLRATDTHLHDKKKGIFKVKGGDGYIQIARFSKDGPEIRSINIYGASNRPDSPHYADQMEMFNNHEFKSMPMDREGVERMAERIYHPGN